MSRIFLFLLLSIPLLKSNAQTRTIHVLVALCDNINQGIVPVPAKIGNGRDPFNNLYWGAMYGVKTYFKKQSDWKLLKQINNPEKGILERLVFKHTSNDVYMIADAYDGAFIKQTTKDFFDFSAGLRKAEVKIDSVSIKCGGNANLICYVGHDGLMDFSLESYPEKADNAKRETIILACFSKSYFKDHIKKSGAIPLLWSSHLMSPEAYTLHAAIQGWVIKETNEQIRERAAQAYHKFQKCGIKGARNLLLTGW